MIMRSDSRALRALLILTSPAPWLPRLLPLWIEPARVGTDYSSFVRVTLKF